MNKKVGSSKLHAELSKLGPDEQQRAMEYIGELRSAAKTGDTGHARPEPEAPDILDLIDELGIEIARLNFLYDFTSFIDPASFRFTGTGASGLNLFIEERLQALRRISDLMLS